MKDVFLLIVGIILINCMHTQQKPLLYTGAYSMW